MSTIIGIDPGTNGGIAWITDGKPCVEKMPDTLQDLWELFRDIASEGDCRAYLEQIHSSPQMGVVSSFTFGNGFDHRLVFLLARHLRADHDEIKHHEHQDQRHDGQ